MARKIAVFGSNSFSGSAFIDYLLEQTPHQIIGLSRSPEKPDIYLPYKRHNDSRFKFYQADFNSDLTKIFNILNDFRPEIV